MKTFKLSAIVVLFFMASACSFNSTSLNSEEDKQEAEVITNKYHSLLKSKNYDAAFKLFSDKFWTVTSKEKTKEMYQLLDRKLGDFDTASLDHFESKVVKGTNPSSEYILYYLCQYKNFAAKETLRLVKEGNTIRIVAFNINSDGLLK